MNDEGVVAILGLVLMTQPDQTVRVPRELIENGLPADSSVRVYEDIAADELVISIAKNEDAE